MKLNKETREVLKKELDWLPGLLPKDVGEFKVEVFDLDALSMQLRLIGHDIFRIYLIDVDGKVIGEVGRQCLYRRFSWVTRKLLSLVLSSVKSDGYHYDDWIFYENLEQAIKRLKSESWRTQFVLHIDGYNATLCKIPRGRSLSVQLETKRQEEQKRLARFLQDN